MTTSVIMLALSCMVFLAGTVSPACDDPATDDTATRELELARDVAVLELGGDSPFPEFEGASLVSAQPYYDLEGNLICHMSGVGRNGEIVGAIIVGSSAYDNRVLEANTAPPPSAPSAAEAGESLERDLGIVVDQRSVAEPECLLHLGPCNDWALYDIEGRPLAVHLWTKLAAPASELKFAMSSPEQMRQYDETRDLQ